MVPADQTILMGNPEGRPGDCWRACIASLLEVPTLDVPHFIELEDTLGSWLTKTNMWLAERKLTIDRCQVWHVDATLPFVILGGPGPRGVLHVVIGSIADMSMEVRRTARIFEVPTVHDPHPSREGLLSVTSLWALSHLS